MNIIEMLRGRELLAQCTNLDKVEKTLIEEKTTFYIGFDPTASSLHIGHFMQMKNIKYLQDAGHKPIVIFGGGTAMVGDPTGRTDMRKMLTAEDIDANIANFKKIMANFVDISEGKAIFVNNADWLLKLNYVEFLRDVGVHYSVNRMLAAECNKSRFEQGLSFLEFNYMLMQGYDFYRLYKDYNCTLQLGGDDQWSNIISGVELIRRKEAAEVWGLTTALLPDASGVKMGKTAGNAVWIDPSKTTPYDFYQHWRNVDDSLVIKYMKMATYMPLEEIAEFETYKDEKINIAKEKLAFEVTKAVHNEDEAKKAQATAKALFSSGGMAEENMPSETVSADIFTDDAVSVIDLLVAVKLAPSKSEARRLVEQGGINIDEAKADIKTKVTKAAVQNGIIIKKGKKVYIKVTLS